MWVGVKLQSEVSIGTVHSIINEKWSTYNCHRQEENEATLNKGALYILLLTRQLKLKFGLTIRNALLSF